MAISSADYPGRLRSIPDPPAVLFMRGSPEVLKGPSVAVIGSRRCSLYGRKTARKLAGGLSGAGVCVVSGLARGIDAESHRGAMQQGGRTAAVLGGGLDSIYPSEHTALAEAIARCGCLLSEYPPGVRPTRYSFPERNRIISGLSDAVVVVEAGQRSGTMITVGTALDQGRDVYAVPGEIGRSTSTGTNRLIRDGAGIILSAEEFLQDLGLEVKQNEAVSDDPLVKLLINRELTPDMIISITGSDRSSVSSRLLELELAGAVVRRPGGAFTSVV